MRCITFPIRTAWPVRWPTPGPTLALVEAGAGIRLAAGCARRQGQARGCHPRHRAVARHVARVMIAATRGPPALAPGVFPAGGPPVELSRPVLFLSSCRDFPRQPVSRWAIGRRCPAPDRQTLLWPGVVVHVLAGDGEHGWRLSLGLPAAFIFARYRFPGKALLRAFTTLPFVLPTIVVATAFTALLGPRGLVKRIALSDRPCAHRPALHPLDHPARPHLL